MDKQIFSLIYYTVLHFSHAWWFFSSNRAGCYVLKVIESGANKKAVSACEGALLQVWLTDFKPWDSHGERKESTPTIFSQLVAYWSFFQWIVWRSEHLVYTCTHTCWNHTNINCVTFRNSRVHVHPHMLKSYKQWLIWSLSHSCVSQFVENFKENSKYCLI